MAMLANGLSAQVGRSVVDKTELKGRYDFTLQWTPDPGQSSPGDASLKPPGSTPPPDGPSIFTAVQEQLGLRLESIKAPADIIVIDSAERPSEN
jgi:uncharacterized protein (TIGR03435 family)